MAARRGQRVSPWVAIGAALAVHGSLLGAVRSGAGSLFGPGFAHASAAKLEPKLPDPELDPGCRGDAVLAGGARVTMCFAPWQGDTDTCIDRAMTDLWIERSSCLAQNDPNIAAVSMLSPRAAEKIKQIDPEPLLEMMKDEAQKPKPPPQLAQPQPEPPKQAAPPPPAPSRPQQVVETAKPSEEKAPDNARFLAEYDTRVEHQTVARGAVKEPMVAKSKPEELAAKDNPKEASIKERPDRPRGVDNKAPDVPGTLAMRTPGAQSPADLQQDAKTQGTSQGAIGKLAFDGYMPRRGDGSIEQQRHDRTEIPRGQNGAGGGAPEVPDLKPSEEVLERALGGGNVDHLDEVDNGDETALSAKRWIYASFFNRLKRQVAQNWDPASVWRRSDPTGQVYGFKTRITEVRVSLSTRGELAKIVVTAPSGVSDLDDEAVRAFHAAAPFVNPPGELAANDHLITFAFSFYFEIGAPHTSWRVIRSM